MPRFSANLSTLFTELPFEKRFAAAADCGFRAVEAQFPYEMSLYDIAGQLAVHRLEMVLFNLAPGDFAAGDRGMACQPGREQEFLDTVTQAMAYARATGCKLMHCMAGRVPEGVSREKAEAVLLANLAKAADMLAEEDMTLLLEPLNSHDVPGYFYSRSREAAAIIAALGKPNVKLQYDFYHMQRMEGALAETFERLLPIIGHIQFADTPGRHEPGTGEINYDFLFPLIDRLGWQGHVGAEYFPSGKSYDSLAWFAERS